MSKFIVAQKNNKIYYLDGNNPMEFLSMLPLVPLGTQSSARSSGFGLTQAEANTLYTGTRLEGKVTIVGNGWHKIIAEKTKMFTLEVAGGDGGSAGANTDKDFVKGGRGAILKAKTMLNTGDELLVLVGNHGWCNNNNDWGACGGGASIVLKYNPNGQYTLAADGRKYDILVVAGGGAGRTDQSRDRVNRVSEDGNALNAKLENGANTNDGTSSYAYGGYGIVSILTGAGEATSPSYSDHPRTWGGGGDSYDGGGGGGGYSGGNAVNDYPSYGGTSYINPTLCTEISRELRPFVIDEPSQNGYVRIK